LSRVITEVGHHLPNQAAASDPLPSSSTTILPTLLGRKFIVISYAMAILINYVKMFLQHFFNISLTWKVNILISSKA
jgi:hypothetical protein